jgi:hypothetical protein
MKPAPSFLLSIFRIAFLGGSTGHFRDLIVAYYSYRYGDFIKFYLLTRFGRVSGEGCLSSGQHEIHLHLGVDLYRISV